MAGHSRRFQAAGLHTPKAFLKIGNKLMIEHVVEMFDQEDIYHFVLNQNQFDQYSKEVGELKKLVKNCNLTVIPPHDFGPTFSALQVQGIPSSAEVIISYCDFKVCWNYPKFLRDARQNDASVPIFKGFHPASFGNTYYAYIRANENSFEELREKKSFTTKRSEEPASVGIYYFRNYKTFEKYSKQLISSPLGQMNEAYTSLLFNKMKEDGLEISIYEVDKFICLGTPEDVEQYNFWFNCFNKNSNGHDKIYEQTNLIPVAGLGQRFQDAGHKVLKPFIAVDNKPMFETACKTFPKSTKWFFLFQNENIQKYSLELLIKNKFENATVLGIDHETSGQASTCLIAKSQIEGHLPLFIASCDYKTIYNYEKWQQIVEDYSVDGVIWTFRLKNTLVKNYNSFAYCKTAKDQKTVLEIVEKKIISETPAQDPMVVGSFWYRKASDFIVSAESMISKNTRINGEFYVGTSINQLIKNGKKIVIFDIDQWITFGDPFELEIYNYWGEYFKYDEFNSTY